MAAGIFTIPIQAGMNIASTLFNNMLAQDNYQQSARTNFMYNERSAENADRRTRALYYDLYSAEAKLKQAQKAGLSPSVIAGGEALGAGGSTAGAMAAGATGNQIPTFAINPLDMSQIHLNEAMANKANADANKTKGVDTQLTITQISKALEEAGYYKTAAAYNTAQTSFTTLATTLKELTFNSDLQNAISTANKTTADAEKALYEAYNEKIKYNINQETKEEQIKQVRETTLNIISDTALKLSQKEYTNEQKNAVKIQLEQGWRKLEIDSLMAEIQNAMVDAKYEEIEKNAENIANQIAAQLKIAGIKTDTEKGGQILSFGKGIITALIMGSVLLLTKNPSAATAAGAATEITAEAGLSSLLGF